MYKVLTIAGSDPSGGAGIQADIKTISNLGCFPSSAITAITIQNTTGIKNIYPIDYKVIIEQIEAVLDDYDIDVIKLGMITPEIIDYLSALDKKIVVDPVLKASDGSDLFSDYELYKKLLKSAYIVTPNIYEASKISGKEINNVTDMIDAAKVIYDFGTNVLVKGGHLQGDAIDVLYTGKLYQFTNKRLVSSNNHGTGCVLASAIASYLARGFNIEDAVSLSKDYVFKALELNLDIGKGNGPLAVPRLVD